MDISLWLVAGVASVDLTIVLLLTWYLRSSAPLDRTIMFPVVAGLAGFLFHACLFFAGTVLVLQLATILSIGTLCFLHTSKRTATPPE